jgi:hypothetical protein
LWLDCIAGVLVQSPKVQSADLVSLNPKAGLKQDQEKVPVGVQHGRAALPEEAV